MSARLAITLVVAGICVDGCSLFRTESPAPPPGAAPTHVGIASWYGGAFQGRCTASGERFDRRRLTAASLALPIGARVRVTNIENGASVVLRINDRGPYVHG